MVVSCVCFIGTNNEPVSLQFFDSEDVISMQFAVYAAVDVIEEKLQGQQRGGAGIMPAAGGATAAAPAAAAADCFMGAICPALCLTRDYLLYAYVTTTGVKIVVAIEQRSQYSNQDVRNLFRRLHRLYADSVCNPFLLGSIETPVFLNQLDAIVAYYSKKLEEGA